MRILGVTKRLDNSGAPIALLRLFSALTDQHDLSILCTAGPDGPLAAEFTAAGIPVLPKVRLTDFDLIVCNTLFTSHIVKQCRDLGVPTLWWIHEGAAGKRVLEKGTQSGDAFPAAGLIVFPTEWQIDRIYSPWLEQARSQVVPMGVSTPASSASPFTRRHDDLILVQGGTIAARKGGDLTVQAIRTLEDSRISTYFVGQSIPAFDLGIKPEESNRMMTLDAIPSSQFAGYLQHADAVLLPTRDDLIALVLLEAMSLGVCVLASNFGPIPETVRHGVTGLLSPMDRHQELAGNIRLIQRYPTMRADLAEAGRELCLAKHGFAAHVAGMAEAMDQAARG